jgi:sugar lactone lactonase YvrE
VHPPAWAAARRIHFDPASPADSPYTRTGEISQSTRGTASGGAPRLSQGAETVEPGGGPLLYDEEELVQHTPTVHLILWGKNFRSVSEGGTKTGEEDQTMLKEYFGALSKSAYQGILTQYFDSSSRVAPEIVFPTPYIDESEAAPTGVEGEGIEKEVAKAIAANKANGWVVEQNAQFVVATAPGSTYASNFTGNFCAYHSVTRGGAIYGFDPYQGDPRFAGGCLPEDVEHNGVHMTSKVASHEYSETATDPNVGCGWRARGCAGEIGDLCNFNGDRELPGSHAWAQGEYDDHLGGCAYNDPNPPHVLAVREPPASAVGATEATISATVNAEGEANTSYFFEYGPTAKYGTRVPTAAEGNTPVEANRKNHVVSKKLANLQKETLYHYRVVAVNGTGTSEGEDGTFTTSRWSTGAVPLPSPPRSASFGGGFSSCFSKNPCGGVSCPSRESCTAVGTYFWYGEENPMAETWNGKEWSFASLPFPEGPTDQEFNGPKGVALDSKGNLWVADTGNNRVDELSSSTGEILGEFGGEGTAGGKFKEPVGVAVDAHEHVWVTDSANSRVQELSSSTGAFIATFGWGVKDGKEALESCTEAAKCRAGLAGPVSGELNKPTGIAVAPSGDLWVADAENNRIEKFSAEGQFLTTSGTSGTGGGQFSAPAGLVTDSHENVWVVDSRNNRVQEISKTGGFVQTFGWGVKDGKEELETCTGQSCRAGLAGGHTGQFNTPAGIALENGDLWVVDGNNRVEGFKPEPGRGVQYLATYGRYSYFPGPLFFSPWGIAVGGGFQYIGDTRNSRIDKWAAPTSEGAAPTYSTSFGGLAFAVAMTGISCPSASTCLAVGYEENTAGARVPVAASWNGTEWSIARIGPPNGASEAAFLGVSCFAANECVAVGFSGTKSGAKSPFAALWKGGTWSVQSLPALSEIANAMLEGVSCTSASFCMAVGFSEKSGGATSPVVESLSGTSWTLGSPKIPARQTPSVVKLTGVSCASSSACTAVGYYISSSLQGLAERWNGKEWAVQPTAHAGLNEELAGVSCPSAEQCTAVGDAERSGRYVAQVQIWNGVEWRPQIVSIGETVPSELHAVSCVPEMCAAVGANGWSARGRSVSLPAEPLALTTVPVPSPGVSTGSTRNVTATNATLTGSVQPNGWPTTYHFEYGPTTSYGSTAPVPDASLKSETTAEEVAGTAIVAPGREYHYRLVATDAGGTTYGADGTFTTPAAAAPSFTSALGELGSAAGQLNGPAYVALDSSGNVWVTDAANNRVEEFGPEGKFLMTFGWGVSDEKPQLETCKSACHAGISGSGLGQFAQPGGIAIAPSGNVWVADPNNGRLEEFSSTGEKPTELKDASFSGIVGITVDSAGNVWVAGRGNNIVFEFSASGELLKELVSSWATDVAVDASGNVWVVNSNEASVEEYSKEGRFTASYGWGVKDGEAKLERCASECRAGIAGLGNGQFNFPTGISIDEKGILWITDTGNNRIEEFTPAGEYIAQFGSGGSLPEQFSSPAGVAVGHGSAYVADRSNNQVKRWLVTE